MELRHRVKKENNDIEFGNKGFSLIELVVVLSIIAILAVFAVPNYSRYVKKTEKAVCDTNCAKIGRDYELYLIIEEIKHSELVFNQFMQENGYDICPVNGYISYEKGKVRCSEHSKDEDDNSDDDDGEVPFL